MSSDVKDFLDQTKVDIEALGGGATFNRVMILPSLDMEIVMKNPRWPTAVMLDGGGTLDKDNHKIWTRTMEVVVIDAHPRDAWGEESVRQVLDLGEVLIAGLEYNINDSLFLEGDSDFASEVTTLGLLIVGKSYNFEYELERS